MNTQCPLKSLAFMAAMAAATFVVTAAGAADASSLPRADFVSPRAADGSIAYFGPTPYAQRSDVPAGFAQGVTLVVEDFEDGVFDPRISISGGNSIIGPGGITDSVDADDGVVDGSGTNGRSWFQFGSIRISFQPPYPHRAGLVWTDGGGNVSLEAFGPDGQSLGVHGPFALGDGSISGTTAEDRFLGAANAAGISRIELSQSGGIEIDHIQFDAPPDLIFQNGFENRPPKTSGIGTNLEGLADYAAAYPFTDFFKQSRPWITASDTVFDTGDAALLDLDADGWVRSLPACTSDPQQFCHARTVFNAAEAAYPSGTYLVLYDGSGTLSYGGGATKNVSASTPGRDVLTVNGHSIWILTLMNTAAAPNHVRNIRVYPPGFDPAMAPVPRFHPDFLAKLAPYRSLRFMDWMRTNGDGFGGAANPQVNFADRTLLSHAHWTRITGAPVEVMIELSNLTGTEPWFTLPHKASNAYVTAFAQMVRAQLEPGRRVYVEHSNEVWNAFPQGFDVEQAGQANFPGGSASGYTKRMNQHGLRTRQICDLFRQAFGTDAARIECVIGSQAANAFTATEAADCPLAVAAGLVTGGRCLGAGDSIAIAPYFGNYLDGPVNADEVVSWDLTKLFAELDQGGQLTDNNANGQSPNPPDADDVETPCTGFPPATNAPPCTISALAQTTAWMSANRQAANQRGMAMIAYEGGQHLVGILGVENTTAITNLFIAANRDPRMGTAYANYLSQWKANGGELFMNFTLSSGYGKFGSWGAIESLTQTPEPPKHRAILDFITANPCWWTACTQ